MQNPYLHNPQLEGDAFFWKGGSVGILLTHGYTATTNEVRLLAHKLKDQGFTVAGPLLAGHGTRPQDLNHVTWQDWVKSAEQTYQQLAAECSQVFVGGTSMGALTALYLASEHPEIKGVLTYAPAIKVTLKTIEVIQLRIASLFISQMARTSMDRADMWQGYPGLPLKGAVQLLNFQRQVIGRLPTINQPMIVFQGRLDKTVHPTAGEIILQGVSSTLKEHHWMENSTHVLILDRELDQISELTIAFIDKALKLAR